MLASQTTSVGNLGRLLYQRASKRNWQKCSIARSKKAHLDYIWLPNRLLDEGECNYNEGVLEEAEADDERAREKTDANAAKAAKAKVPKAANAEAEAKVTKAAKAKATRASKAKLV